MSIEIVRKNPLKIRLKGSSSVYKLIYNNVHFILKKLRFIKIVDTWMQENNYVIDLHFSDKKVR